jgi:PKHD-type hydroxylase
VLLLIERVLNAEEVAVFRDALRAAPWLDGQATAGSLSAHVKRNEQVDDRSEVARRLGDRLRERLGRHPLFVSAALPARIHPPRFNRYRGGQTYGTHVDAAVMALPGTERLLRADVSATLFLSEPAEYDGGELVIEGEFGAQEVKLAAGDLVLYPSSSLHRVTPVTRGERLAALLWIQSLIADAPARALLFDLDQSIQSLSRSHASDDPTLLRLTAVYHNLVRRWAQP